MYTSPFGGDDVDSMLVHCSGEVGWQVICQILEFHFVASICQSRLAAIVTTTKQISMTFIRESWSSTM